MSTRTVKQSRQSVARVRTSNGSIPRGPAANGKKAESLAGLLCFERKCVLEREEKAAGINKTPFLMLVGLLTC